MESESADVVLEIDSFRLAALELRVGFRLKFDAHVLKIEHGAVKKVAGDRDVAVFAVERRVHQFESRAGETSAVARLRLETE